MEITISKPNRSLIIPRSPAITNLFPDAPDLGDGSVVLPHSLRETLLLRHIGINVPNPMLWYYDWRGGTPYKVQKTTCDLLTSNPRAYCLNDLGTGKTRSALWAWDWLYRNKDCGKALVVCPISTMNFVWAREVFSAMPDRKVQVLYGSKAQRLERLKEEADVYVVNHDGLRTIAEELHARTDIDLLILDELAVYRNNSDRSKLMRKFAQRFNWVWGMTGEPMPNAPTDVWSQGKIVTPNTVPKYFRTAQELLMTKCGQFKWAPKADAIDKAFHMMQPSVRFNLDDVVELPEVVYRTIDVELTPVQKKIYNLLVKEFKAMHEEKTVTAVNAAAAMNKLLQVSMGRVYTVNPEFLELDSTPRKQTLLDLVDGAAQKVLVFVPFLHVADDLTKFLTDNGIEHTVVTGATEQSERDQKFHLFQNTTKYKVLLAHPQCLAHGITLTAASTIIWYGPTPSLEIYDQANARIRRIGQKNKQQVLHLQATPVERKIYSLLRTKQNAQNKLLEMLEEATENRK